jgi:MYXO-CTERM domain-containing protein
MNVDVEVRLPASLTPRFPLVRTTVSVSGPNVETRQEFTPQQATFNLYKLVVSCAGTSNKPQPGTYRVRVDSELLGVGKLAASDKEFQIVCPASTKPNDDPKTRDPWLGEGPTDDDPPSTPGNGGTSSSGSCSNSGGRPQGGALGLLLGAMGVALVARRRRR